MRSDSCSKKVVKCLQSMKHVEEFDVNLAEKKVTVTGRVDPKKLIKKLENKSGRHAEFWTERSLASLESRKSWRFGSSFRDSFKRVTTIFNDEDTNSCSIM
ncbi:hypothetical protein KP509_12G031100 [Ceratopteris richardii]|nr:hypothetical protein KP509_12G031100 [Ceratopteris richardii]